MAGPPAQGPPDLLEALSRLAGSRRPAEPHPWPVLRIRVRRMCRRLCRWRNREGVTVRHNYVDRSQGPSLAGRQILLRHVCHVDAIDGTRRLDVFARLVLVLFRQTIVRTPSRSARNNGSVHIGFASSHTPLPKCTCHAHRNSTSYHGSGESAPCPPSPGPSASSAPCPPSPGPPASPAPCPPSPGPPASSAHCPPSPGPPASPRSTCLSAPPSCASSGCNPGPMSE